MVAGESVLALDIGGSKISGAVVGADGEIFRHTKVPVQVTQGKQAFFDQLIHVITELSRDFVLRKVGIGCAGPLDPIAGELLDPTNFFTEGKSWGRLSLLEPLRAHWPKWQFALDNDAAAAVLGEAWLGGGPSDHLVAITLGTGVGVGVLVSGQLVRMRDQIHPEASHIPLNFADKDKPCGCGNYGCIEAYLAGSHFVRRLGREWNDTNLRGHILVERAKAKDARAIAAFAQYGEWLAQAIHAYAILYGPKQVSLSGGFAVAAPYFLPTTEKRLPELLSRRREGVDLVPKVSVSKLGDNLGVIGAARVAQLCQ